MSPILRPFLPFLLLALLAAPTAAARAVDLQMDAFDDGGRFAFRVTGLAGDNPDLGLRPGEAVTLTLRNTGTTPHNVAFGAPIDAAIPCCLDPGDSATLRFTVPEDARAVEYWCQPHKETLGMRGEAMAPADRGTPGPPLLMLLLALGLGLVRRRA